MRQQALPLPAALTLAVALSTAATLGTQPLSAQENPTLAQLLSQLQAPEPELREAATDALASGYEQLVDGLIAIVAKRDDTREVAYQKLLAVELLGRLRAPKAVQVLADNIAFVSPTWDNVAEEPAWYPCMKALVQIGKPSVAEVLARLRQQPYCKQQLAYLYACVVVLVEGKSTLLEEVAGELPRDSATRSHLERVIDQLAPRAPAQ